MEFLFLLFLTCHIMCCTQAGGYDHYRLPKSIRPTKYDLSVITHLTNAKTNNNNNNNNHFEGIVTIRLNVLQDTTNITLHSSALTIDQSKIILRHIPTHVANCITSTETNVEHEYYIMHLCDKLEADEVYDLTIPFSAKLSENLLGYYQSSYKVKPSETRLFAVTQFQPTYARTAFPCFDEPDFKAIFNISLSHHRNYTSLSNMELKKIRINSDFRNYIWRDFHLSPPMSTYLVAYSVNDFSMMTNSRINDRVQLRTWAPARTIEKCEFGVQFTPIVLNYFENLFDTHMPLSKIDQISLPEFNFVGMENWGLITYNQENFLHKMNVTPVIQEQAITHLIAHEIAHQWFGNLVTMEWWTDLWLNEGFATYISGLGVGHAYPEWQFLEKDMISSLVSILRRDAFAHSRALSAPVFSTQNMLSKFDDITYKKGALVTRMLHFILGDTNFRNGLVKFFRVYAYRNANADNLWDIFRQSAHKNMHKFNIRTVMDNWIRQPGYPVLNITRDYAAGSVTITQNRFLLTQNETQPPQCWWVPLSTLDTLHFNDTRPKSWLKCTDSGVTVPKRMAVNALQDWIIYNPKFGIIYRANYDAQNWRHIIDQLHARHDIINFLNRAQLIDDVLNLAWAGYQPYDIAFSLLSYLTKEKHYIPWQVASENIFSIYAIAQHNDDVQAQLKVYMQRIISPIYQHLAEINKNFAQLVAYKTEQLKIEIAHMACFFELDHCVRDALNSFRKWHKATDANKEQVIEPNLRFVVFCTAIRHGEAENWHRVWTYYKGSGTKLKSMLDALACTTDTDLLRSLKESSFDKSKIANYQHAISALERIASNKKGYKLLLQSLLTNGVHKRFAMNPGVLLNAFHNLAQQMYTVLEHQQVRKFIETHKKKFQMVGIDVELNNMLSIIDANIVWKNRRHDEMVRALKKIALI